MKEEFENYMKKRGGRLITATRNKIDNTSINKTKITPKMGRKTTIWKNLDMAKKGKP